MPSSYLNSLPAPSLLIALLRILIPPLLPPHSPIPILLLSSPAPLLLASCSFCRLNLCFFISVASSSSSLSYTSSSTFFSSNSSYPPLFPPPPPTSPLLTSFPCCSCSYCFSHCSYYGCTHSFHCFSSLHPSLSLAVAAATAAAAESVSSFIRRG